MGAREKAEKKRDREIAAIRNDNIKHISDHVFTVLSRDSSLGTIRHEIAHPRAKGKKEQYVLRFYSGNFFGKKNLLVLTVLYSNATQTKPKITIGQYDQNILTLIRQIKIGLGKKYSVVAPAELNKEVAV